MDTKQWIIDWFASHSTVDKDTIIAKCDVNYFEAEFIDSFNFIFLVGDIEDSFKIKFTNDQFVDRSFATINGLVAIIDTLLKENQ